MGWRILVTNIFATATVGTALASMALAGLLFLVTNDFSWIPGIAFFGWLAALPVALAAVALAGPLANRVMPPGQGSAVKAGLVTVMVGAVFGAAMMVLLWRLQAEVAAIGALYGGVIGGCWWRFNRPHRT